MKVVGGEIVNLELHEERIFRTIGWIPKINKSLTSCSGTLKYRITYNINGIISKELTEYSIKPIGSLKLVMADSIDYSYKYLNREVINSLMKKRGDADDIIIVKEGRITDTSYCNIVLENSNGLFTPSQPLLRGTKRELLIRTGIIKEKDISFSELIGFDRIHLINAMIDLEDNIIIEKYRIDTGDIL